MLRLKDGNRSVTERKKEQDVIRKSKTTNKYPGNHKIMLFIGIVVLIIGISIPGIYGMVSNETEAHVDADNSFSEMLNNLCAAAVGLSDKENSRSDYNEPGDTAPGIGKENSDIAGNGDDITGENDEKQLPASEPTPENTEDNGNIPEKKDRQNIYLPETDEDYIKSGKPVVLIIHTHLSEAYSETIINPGEKDMESGRSDDTQLNVASVGNKFAKTLAENGIGVIHCTESFEKNGLRGSYARAEDRISEYMKEYHGIGYIVDIHRENTLKPDNTASGETVKENGTDAAILYLSAGGEKYLPAALYFRKRVNMKYPGICAPVKMCETELNQDKAAEYGALMLTLSVGSTGNSLEEAGYSAELAAEIIGSIISENIR